MASSKSSKSSRLADSSKSSKSSISSSSSSSHSSSSSSSSSHSSSDSSASSRSSSSSSRDSSRSSGGIRCINAANLTPPNEYFKGGNPPQLNFDGEFSLSIWFKHKDKFASDVLFSKTATSNAGIGWRLRIHTSLTFNIQDALGHQVIASSTNLFGEDVWYHAVAVFKIDSGGFRPIVYLDGRRVGSTLDKSHKGTWSNSANFNIGINDNEVGDMDGLLAFPRMWNRALTSSDVKQLHNDGTPQCFEAMSDPLRDGLVGAWELANWDGSVGTEIEDRTIFGNDLINHLNRVPFNRGTLGRDLSVECYGITSSCSSNSSFISSSSRSSSSDSSSSSRSSFIPPDVYVSKFLGNSISVDGECYAFTREIFERREVRNFLGIVSGFIDCNECFDVEVCGDPNDEPTMFATFSWTDSDISKSWLGCNWTNGETKEVFASFYIKQYNSTIFPDTTGIPYEGNEFWKKVVGTYNLMEFRANPVRFFRLISGSPNVFDYRIWQYQELDIKYSANQRRFWQNKFYYTYGGGPPTGDTYLRYYTAGSPVVVTGAPNPGVFNITQDRISDNMLNGEMLYASGLRFKWVKGNGW